MLKKSIQLAKDRSGMIWEEDEQILMFIRRHPLALWPAYLSVSLIILIIVIFIFLFYSFNLNQFLISFDLVVNPNKIFWLIIFMFVLTLFLFLYLSWMQYYLDITIVTNRRVIDIQQLTLFQRKIVSTDLLSIQDVRSEVKGFFQSTFDFGTVSIQTAGEAPNFTLRDLPKPSKVVREISAASNLILNPDKGLDKTLSGENYLKKHESEFTQEFTQNENQTSISEKVVKQKELNEEIKNQSSIPGVEVGQDKKKKSHPIRSLPFPRRRESSKRIIHYRNKGEIDF